MRVIRLQKGHRLDLTDLEFKALRVLANYGSLVTVENPDWITCEAPGNTPPGVIRAMQKFDLAITEDRRKRASPPATAFRKPPRVRRPPSGRSGA